MTSSESDRRPAEPFGTANAPVEAPTEWRSPEDWSADGRSHRSDTSAPSAQQEFAAPAPMPAPVSSTGPAVPDGYGVPAPQQGMAGLAVAALACGIVSIPVALLVAIGGIALGVVALVFGIMSRRYRTMHGKAVAGMVTGVVGVVVGVVNAIFGALLFAGKLHL